MNTNREEALFALAMSKPAAKRAAWLDAECEGDSALRQRLDALLSASAELFPEGATGSENDIAFRVGGRNQNWAPMALADRKLLIRDQTQLKCVKVAQ